MSSPIRPYSSYRKCHIPWASECPSHWEVARPKTFFRLVQRPVRPEDEVVTCFRDGVVTLRKNRRLTGFTESLKEIGYQGIRRGDLVIHAMDAFAGAIGVSDSDGKGTPVYAVCQPSLEANPHYFAALLREMSCSGYLLALAKGIRERSTDFRYEDFATQFVLLPPRHEQDAIVRFIDHLDHRVNRLISDKRRLIELLNEQKRALIAGLFLRRDTDSGESLWQIGHFAKVGNGSTPSRGNLSYWASNAVDGFPWLNSASVNQEVISTSDQYVTEVALRECHLPIVQRGSVLVAITGQGKTRGTAALLDMVATINQHVAYITPRNSLVSPEYLHLVLSASYEHLREVSEASGSTKGALTCGDLKKFKVYVPNRKIQERLIQKSREESSEIARAIDAARQELDLLREYRARLVADVVTGKLDVRHLDLPQIKDMLLSDLIDIEDSSEEGEREEALV